MTWGYRNSGADVSAVQDELTSGVEEIYSTASAFAAVKSDGSVVTWGADNYGGNSDGIDWH